MRPASRTPEGWPDQCPLCGYDVCLEPSLESHDAPCPRCGHLIWFDTSGRGEFSRPEFEFIRDIQVQKLLKCDSKPQAICQLVVGLAEAGQLPQNVVDNVVRAVLKREELGSTAVGHGFALPHARLASITAPMSALGTSQQGIDFDSLDGKPVTRVLLLLSPIGDEAGFLKQLECATRAIRVMA